MQTSNNTNKHIAAKFCVQTIAPSRYSDNSTHSVAAFDATTIYSDKFLKAFQTLIKIEGCYTNNCIDRGKSTKFGISKRSYPYLDICNLKLEEAKNIYHTDYWQAYDYDAIDDDRIAAKVFHTTVHTGAKQSHIILQRALCAAGNKVIEDGIIGYKTINAVNSIDPSILIVGLRSEAAGFYRLLAATKENYKCFVKGWLKRAYM